MIRIIGFIVTLLFTSTCYGQDASTAFLADRESMELVYLDKKTSEPRSVISSSLEKVVRNGKVFYKLTQKGKGDYDKYKNVTWEAVADMEVRADGLIYPLFVTRIIRDEKQAVVVKYDKKFEYNNKRSRIIYTKMNAAGRVLAKKVFPVKGKTADDLTLTFFLKQFIANRDSKEYSQFYLVTEEPRLYKVDIQIIGEEEIVFPEGKFKVVKIRTIPDLGLLTGIVKAIVPPTYFWYASDSPYSWLQYEGLECGLGTTHVVIRVNSRAPAL